ncbi:MAG TPA: helix-turn-helix domain-containing protein [Nitrospirota bacterium]|nr:helix-turn-helix domain-containing protein [Nitrospirota bacterium]
MLKKIENLNYYELLEVSPTATSQEIHKAYERVRRIYEPNSTALYSLFSADETTAIHQRIEEAYRTLIYEDNRKRYDELLRHQNDFPEPTPPPQPATYKQQPAQPALSLPLDYNSRVSAEPSQAQVQETPAPPEKVALVSQFITEFSGAAIKALREQRGLSLRDVADATKLSVRYLEMIEQENFLRLPVRAYTRGFLTLYANALSCDPDRMTGDYLKRYDAARAPKSK